MPQTGANTPSGQSSVDRYKLLLRLQVLAAIGCLLILVYALHFWNFGEVLRIFGAGLLVAGAALLSGVLLGFIFGIPRVGRENLSANAAAEPGSAHATAGQTDSGNVTSNSNLVEISDWLTKILVGVGLVELNSIPGKLWSLSRYLEPGLRPAVCDGRVPCGDLVGGAAAVALAILLFYFTLGFLWGYVWTRLYFQRDLGGLIENLQRNQRVTDSIMSAEASINEGDLDEALRFVNQAIQSDPQDGRAILTKGRILKRQAMIADQEGSQKLLAQALECANQAIVLLPTKGEPLYNKACYQALLGANRNEILGNLKAAFNLNPALRRIAADDRDLDAVRQDADFKSLVQVTQQP